MARNYNGKKYDLACLVDPVTQEKQWISPSNLIIYIGTVITDEKGNKKVGSALPKELGVFLSEKDNEIDQLRKEVGEFKSTYRKNTKYLLNIIEILIGQTEVNGLTLSEIKDNLEGK